MRVGPAVNVARVSVDETITALWTFANALGLLTDDINERTASAGVTIDDLHILNGSIRSALQASAGNSLLLGRVVGDVQDRIRLLMSGAMSWGDGTAARDTNLFRSAANLLKTDDSLEVAGVLGVVTDDINERTAAAGVTIDGALIKDTAFVALALALVGDLVFRTNVTGDVADRLAIRADGILVWGDGAGAADTNLFRAAADELATADDFNVGGALDLAGDIEIEDRVITLAAGANDDVATGTVTVQRMDSSAGVADITGFAGGRTGRVLVVVNVTTNAITLKQNDAGSVAANRMFLPNAADLVLSQDEALWLYYDANGPIWRALAFV